MKYNKEEILKLKTFDDLKFYEQDLIEDFRNNFYNTILKDKEIVNHLEKIIGTDKENLEYELMINDKLELLPDIDIKNTNN